MSRSRHKKSSPARRLLAVMVVLAFLGWGAWQWRVVYSAILRDVPREAAAEVVPAPKVATNTFAVATPAQQYGDAVTESGDPAATEDAAIAQNGAAAPRNILSGPDEDLSTEALANRGREIDLLIAGADEAAEAGDILEQREQLNQALALAGESARGPEIREALEAINSGIFMNSDVVVQDPYAPLLSIEPGDSFTSLGRRYHITPELLAALNPQLSERDLHPGRGIKIVQGPFHARVVKHDLRLDLYARDMYVRSYKIQLDDGNFLPVGTYRIRSGARIRVAAGDNVPPRDWIGWEPVAGGSRGIDEAWFYGSSGPRRTGGQSGVRLDDSDLRTVYNALVERDSLVRVDP